ncbi:hypothetical protein [Shewanella sp. CG_4_10_14_0_8_um_filter_42_13]|uniref:hypothetical protein n=1 Tax=Shewanella sp. CG_4_10_14_0_8_um_filter_42_13 TaxID=1975534 RepID=UPI000CC0B76C|nr:hypothetical protein [Shewanella sp. CG_4_10_14_0_8_um_filter_42_13]PIY67107.1 MAG: hypothetical protein COY92_07205 [Shewanella sp. CG_4_10_14_0_8_um_filter_42_13]
MKTVQYYLDLGIKFIKGDVVIGHDNCEYSTDWYKFLQDETGNCWLDFNIRLFAWRDLTTKPDNPQYKIELDIANHCWRPSLNQDVAPVNPTEFKVGDLVEVEHCAIGKYLVKIKYIDTVSLFGYLQSDDNQPPRMDQFCEYMKDITINPYNPRLNELKDIIGTHDDPTECAKAILAAGYTK